MVVVDVCDLLVDISQLHVALIHLVVVNHLVYLLDPLVVHEHAVVTLSNHLLTPHEFVVLRLHSVTHRLNYRTLLDKRLVGAQRSQDLL